MKSFQTKKENVKTSNSSREMVEAAIENSKGNRSATWESVVKERNTISHRETATHEPISTSQ